MLDLCLTHVGKSFPPARRILDDITLTLPAGECLAILGPSGCGKTTLLRIIAGLETQTEGDLFLGGEKANHVPSHRRNVALLFQRPALVPTQTVRQSLRWAWTLPAPWALWRRRHLREAELERVAAILELERDLDRLVQQLSGGQQQRVALGRCLLRKAPICLLDEPLGHLDAPLRVALRRQIRELAREHSMSMMHVTHDPEEALAVGDRVAIIHDGRIVQIDAPARLKRAPRNRYVAELVHQQLGGLNVLDGTLIRDGERLVFESAFGRWPVPPSQTFGECKNFHAEAGKVHMLLGVAARDVRCDDDGPRRADEIRLRMPVVLRECSSAGTWIIAADRRGRWVGRSDDVEHGNEVMMAFSMDRVYWFDGLTGQTLSAPAE